MPLTQHIMYTMPQHTNLLGIFKSVLKNICF